MNYYVEIIAHYQQKGLLMDTHPLLLFFVGSCDPNLIQTFKHTKIFTLEDYNLLIRLMSPFIRIVATPNILTEVINYLGHLPERTKDVYYPHFSNSVRKLDERFTPSAELAKRKYFNKFGLTDSSIIDNAKGRYLVLTNDFPLFGYLQNIGVDVINFDRLRTLDLLA